MMFTHQQGGGGRHIPPFARKHRLNINSSTSKLRWLSKFLTYLISGLWLSEGLFFCYTSAQGSEMTVLPPLLRFGLFELDVQSGELIKNGRRRKLQNQPFRLLALLLEQPGQIVTRERLQEALWQDDTFVDFDHSLNAAVAKLRQALGDSADNPRFVETLAKRGYRFIAPVEGIATGTAAPDATQAAQASIPEVSRPEPLRATFNYSRFFIVAGAVIAIFAGLAIWWSKTSAVRKPELVKLTDDVGLTTAPAVSADGKLLAYASDRGTGRNLNIWIQQLVPGGTAVQLTHEDADATEPAFSPDSSRIAYHSKRNGGIFVVPVIGGEPHRLTADGRSPHFSPDGRLVVYEAGGPDASVPSGTDGGSIYVLPSEGGVARRIGSDLTASSPVWSPDGNHVLAYSPPAGFAWDQADWWLISLDGTPSKRTGDFRALKHQGFSIGFDRVPQLSQWAHGALLFSAGFGDAVSVWRAPVNADGRFSGPAEQLTSGTNFETSPVLTPSGDLIFASLDRRAAIWDVAADPENAKLTGDLKRITDGRGELMPSVSLDGRTLAYMAVIHQSYDLGDEYLNERGKLQVWTKDLVTGKATAGIEDRLPQWHPQISKDGSVLAYTSGKPGPVYAVAVGSRNRRALALGANFFSWDWSLNNKHLLFNSADQQLHVMDAWGKADHPFLKRLGYTFFQAKFSPDEGAVSVVGCSDEQEGKSACRIFIVPLDAGAPAAPDRWLSIDNGAGNWDDKPRWSPGGRLLYFLSNRDGALCVWAQRIEINGAHLLGSPFPVLHLHNAGLSLGALGTGVLEWDLARDKIILGMSEQAGNLWTARKRSRR